VSNKQLISFRDFDRNIIIDVSEVVAVLNKAKAAMIIYFRGGGSIIVTHQPTCDELWDFLHKELNVTEWEPPTMNGEGSDGLRSAN